ncbi:iron chelate uptake ABC transporter family permease subunit [Burkholderia sp. 22PA0106]|uniref:iron chelate uptake ABC transporter family permease subunit n=1 Tax=Burkholderia sp. 22PA0106 TaxID=3237371 RepID=UPI0039C289B4
MLDATSVAIGRKPGFTQPAGRLGLTCGLLAAGACALFATLIWLTPVPISADDLRRALTPGAETGSGSLGALLLREELLPRLALALAGGAVLSMAGTLSQWIFRSPLASPGTLGIPIGAKVALAAASLIAGGAALPREGVALAGGIASALLCFGLASRRRLTGEALVMCGLLVGLALGALDTVLYLADPEDLASLQVEGTLSTARAWQDLRAIGWLLVFGIGACAALLRPLELLVLDDRHARLLGAQPAVLRLAGLAVATALTAVTVARIGAIGFIGLGAPALARALGARRLVEQIAGAAVLGALILGNADLLTQCAAYRGVANDATGALVGLLGAPLLLLLCLRVRTPHADPVHPRSANAGSGLSAAARARLTLALLLGVAATVGAALWIGRGPSHWTLSADPALFAVRWPRVLAAGAAGSLLAATGLLLQRHTGEAMASPETLGLSAGAAFAMLLGIGVLGVTSRSAILALGLLGAALTLAMVFAWRNAMQDARRLIVFGIILTTGLASARTLVFAQMDPRGPGLMSWLAGSTYGVSAGEAGWTAGIAAICLAAALAMHRWIALLPLGQTVMQGLGVDVVRTRTLLLVLSAVMTAAATCVVGPLAFVGLMAPRLVRPLRTRDMRALVVLTALVGGAIMIAADWLGRVALYPMQLPAGAVASLLGSAWLLATLIRR